MTDYSRHRGWHVYTDRNGETHETSFNMGGWPGFELASRLAADLARRDAESDGALGITRNFVQFLPPGVSPTQF